jgi:hypothetical protein
MSSKLTISLIAALGLSVTTSEVARADPMAGSDEGSEGSSSQDALEDPEADNPHGLDYKDRKVGKPTDGEVDSAETGNPHSVDFKDRGISSHKPTNDEINAGEVDDPDAVQNP